MASGAFSSAFSSAFSLGTPIPYDPTQWIAGVYPDRVWTKPRLATVQHASSRNLDPILNPPAPFDPTSQFSVARYPTWILPRLSLAAGNQQSYTASPSISSLYDGGTLAWTPKHPSFIPPRVSLRAGVQLPWAENLSPLPNALPPTELTWRVTYPDHLLASLTLRRMSTALRASGGILGRPPFADLRWGPIAPAWIARRPIRRSVIPAAAVRDTGALLDLPKRGGWRPTFPARHVYRRSLITGTAVWPTLPILLGAAGCLEWIDRTLIAPTLTEALLQQPSMIDETLILPTVGSEDLC